MPPGVKDLEYSVEAEEGNGSDGMLEFDEIEPDDGEFSGADADWGEESASGDQDRPYPPDYMEVISQVVRTLPGGGQVVDVTIELPDLESGTKYEVRVSK